MAPSDEARAAEQALALGYAPAATRGALTALLALDRRLGELLANGREPMVTQMRLTWWHEALSRLDTTPAPAEPILTALAAEVLPRGVSGIGLAAMIDGWEALLGDPLDGDAMVQFAQHRGGVLFAIAAHVLGAGHPMLIRAGEGWALADLARRLSDPVAVGAAQGLAAARLDGIERDRWPRPLRPLGALALLARADLDGIRPGSPRRVAWLLRHRLTGG